MANLIDKSALVAEINRVLNSYDPNEITSGRYALVSLRNFIDTLEVKEVDLEKEANECWNYVFSALGWDENSLMTMNHKEFMAFAKHFFELGVTVSNKEKKGE